MWTIIAPIFVVLALGFGVQKLHGFDIKSLVRLNFWVFVPSFLFIRIFESKLSPHQFLLIGAHFVLLFVAMLALAWWGGRLIRANDRLRRALTASVVFYNAGNFGLPVVELAFGAFGGGVQAMLIMLQNLSNFTIGLALHAGGDGRGRREVLQEVFKLPMVYVLVVAFSWRASGLPLPVPLSQALHLTADGLVPVALITLGAQMAALESHRWSRALSLSLFLRLIIGPILAFGFCRLLGINGALAQVLIVASSAPTAVNSALLAIEFDNEPDFAAAAVFYSTLAAVFTVSFALWAVRWLA